MNRQSSSEKPSLTRRLIAHIVVIAMAIGFIAFVWVDRQEVFRRLSCPFTDGELALPYGWGIVAVFLLLMQFCCLAEQRLMRWLSIAIASFIMSVIAVLLVGQSDWGRYQVYRCEAFGNHYGITARDRGETELELIETVGDSAVGVLIRQDAEMLEHLVVQCGDQFARKPDQSRIALSSLRETGITLEQLLAQKAAGPFLLYALAGDFYADAEQKSWTQSQSSQFLNQRIQTMNSISDHELEALFFCVANMPKLVGKENQQHVESMWLKRVPQLASLLGEGLRLGEIISEAFVENEIKSIGVSTQEGYQLPCEATRDRIATVLPRSLATLISLKKPADVDLVAQNAARKAGVNITLHLNGESLYQYPQQIMQWRSKFEPGRIRSVGRTRLYQPGRTVTQSVPSGETRARTVLGATVVLEAPFSDKPISTEATLAYWSDYARDEGNTTLHMVDRQELGGRVWPLGIHQSYFLAGATDETHAEQLHNE